MPSARVYEEQGELNTDADRDLVIRTGNKIRKSIRKDTPVVDMVKTATAPGAPLVGQGCYFFQDDGAGKGQFCVRFPSGATQILATEP